MSSPIFVRVLYKVIEYFISKFMKKIRFSSVRYSEIDATSKVESGSNILFVKMGRYSFCGYDCEIICAEIGMFTSIASGVIIGGARHPMEWAGMSPVFYAGRDSIKKKFSEHVLPIAKKTIVGNDVWIGRSAILLSGINIGDGAVIGAGAVVTKDVPAYAIVAGNPARIVRYRFNPKIINELQEIKWWNFSENQLKNAARLVEDPVEFISFLKKNDG